MKKALALLLALVMCLTLAACGGGNTNENTEAKKESIELNVDNIKSYVAFDGEFTNGTYTKSIVNWAEATLEFQAYPTAAGKFNGVEITLVCTSNDHTFTYMNSFGNYWHLSDDDRDEIRITFTLGVDGKFSKNYSVECLNNTGILSGDCDFKIISVKGTFIPD